MSKTILVFINGHAGVGKDTFVNFCKEYAEANKSCKVYNIHRSDAPKMALHTLGWSGEKDTETRVLLKDMVDFMEHKGLLNKYLDDQLKAAKTINTVDVIVFYHVRDPEVMYDLMDTYIKRDDVKPVSMLIKRDLKQPKEPNSWWGDLENADYTISVELPDDDLEASEIAASQLVDFLLNEEWKTVKQEEASWITNS